MSSIRELEMRELFQLKQKVLQELYHDLCQCLDPISHFSYLRSQAVLTRDEQEQIDNVRRSESTSASVRRFLDILITKSNGFDELCKSLLMDRTQMFLAESLNRALEKKINDLRAPHTRQIAIDVSTLPLPDVTDDTCEVSSSDEVSTDSLLSLSSNSSHLQLSSSERGVKCQSTSLA